MSRVVIFDVGNVLVRWEPRAYYAERLGSAAAADAFFEEVDFNAWNAEQDRGRSWDEGVALLTAKYPHRAADIAAARDEWHRMLPGAIDGSVAILNALHAADVPLYALTNFSAEKWVEARERFAFLTTFRDVLVSGEEGMIKPNPAIYEALLTRNGLAAEDCIFIDDSVANVDAAAALGIDAIHFTGPETLGAALAARGIL